MNGGCVSIRGGTIGSLQLSRLCMLPYQDLAGIAMCRDAEACSRCHCDG